MPHRLSKSKYLAGLQCHKRLWLEIHRRELIPPVPPSQQRIFDQGTLVGELAREQFPGGVLIEADYEHLSEGAKETAVVLTQGADVIFEAVISHDGILVRPDVIRRNETGGWDLIEVKSSTGIKDIYIDDVAIQTQVLNGAGLDVRSAGLMHINTECTYPDLSNLFTIEDITELVGDALPGIPERVAELRAMLALDFEPDLQIGQHCHKPYGCEFIELCWSWVPELSIFNIPRLRWPDKAVLLEDGLVAISDLPRELRLNENQRRFVRSCELQEPVIYHDLIQEELAGLEYPLHFLDFETDNPAVPRFDGMHPYGQFPYQYSCNVLHENGDISHMEYLHESESDPRKHLVESLIDAVRKEGTVVAYNAPFEKGVIKKLVESLPEYAGELQSIADRLWDQLVIFRDYYTDYRFRGSNGLKNVLPVIVPDMSYDGMAVSDGTDAGVVWNDMIRLPDGEEKDQKILDLKEYCGQDTWAMVQIHRVLEGL
jgi:hypothetical protein